MDTGDAVRDGGVTSTSSERGCGVATPFAMGAAAAGLGSGDTMGWCEVTLKNDEEPLLGVIVNVVAPDGRPTASRSLSTDNSRSRLRSRRMPNDSFDTFLARLGRGVGDMGVVPESDEVCWWWWRCGVVGRSTEVMSMDGK
jgi:hypothetical protein